VIQNAGQTDEFYGNLDKKSGDSFAAIYDAGVNAQSKIAQIDRMERLLSSAPQGATGALTQIAGNFGINIEGLSEVQAATALINQLVPQQRQPGSGPMSDADLALFKQSLPRIINQPDGNRIIMNTMRGIAQYEQQQGQIAAHVMNREMSPADGRKALMELQNPLAFLNDVNAPPQAVEMLKGNPTPEAQAQFDEVFGKGAAARALGGQR
jgi:flagellar protein FlgJ